MCLSSGKHVFGGLIMIIHVTGSESILFQCSCSHFVFETRELGVYSPRSRTENSVLGRVEYAGTCTGAVLTPKSHTTPFAGAAGTKMADFRKSSENFVCEIHLANLGAIFNVLKLK